MSGHSSTLVDGGGIVNPPDSTRCMNSREPSSNPSPSHVAGPNSIRSPPIVNTAEAIPPLPPRIILNRSKTG